MQTDKIHCQHFATLPRPLQVQELAAQLGAPLKGKGGEALIEGVGTIQGAQKNQITFLTDKNQYHKYRQFLATTSAVAIIMNQEAYDQEKDHHIPVIIDSDPRQAIVKAIHILYPKIHFTPLQHSSAVIGEGCDIHPKSYIGPHVVIGKGVKIEENVVIEAQCVIGDNCIVKANTFFHPRVTLYSGVQMGQSCVIHSGTVIGSDGFGYIKQDQRWLKVPQIGTVVIGDRVEIGANTTIDRGAIDNTVIEDDVILDNLIQIGHNVKIGQGTAIAACSAIAGSTEIGKNCLIGGATNFNGHIKIADKVSIVGCSNVSRTITKPGVYASAITENDFKTWKKNLARFHQLDKIATRVLTLETEVKTIAQSQKGD